MKIGPIFTLLAASLFAASTAHAQHYGTTWDGGTGTWNTTNTNWDGANVYFNSNDRTTIAAPIFSNGGGTVTVDESGGTLYNGLMLFENSGNWTFNGDPINSISTDYQAIVVQTEPGAGNVTINNTINIVPNPTNGGSVIQNENAGTTITLGNLNISNIAMAAPYNPNPATGQNPLLFATNGSTIVINGNYTTDTGLTGGLLIGNYGDSSMATGTYIFKGALNENINGGKQFDFGSGNIIFDTSSTGTGPMTFVGAGANLPQTLLTGGAYTISNVIANQGASNAIIGGSTANISTFSGTINAGGSGGEMTYRAAAGGRVYFSGNDNGNNGSTYKDGLGTVVLSSPTGNTFSSTNSTVFEAKAGTTLITNTSGSAFGTTNGTVQVDAGATLGGTGISTQTVVAAGATSIIAPGDAGQANLSIAATTGNLTLAGGLDATTNGGVTFDFKLNGLSNDSVNFGGFGFDPVGSVITLNFLNSGADITQNNYYQIMTTSGGIVDTDATWNLVAPFQYYVSGESFDKFHDSFSVEFKEVPEPSTYALMLGGLGFLALCLRRKNRASV